MCKQSFPIYKTMPQHLSYNQIPFAELCLTHWFLGDMAVRLPNALCRPVAWALTAKFLSGECHKTSPHTGQVVNSRSQTQQGQPVTKLETPLQTILVRNVNMIQGRSIKTTSIRYSQRRSDGKHFIGRCVFSNTLVQ